MQITYKGTFSLRNTLWTGTKWVDTTVMCHSVKMSAPMPLTRSAHLIRRFLGKLISVDLSVVVKRRTNNPKVVVSNHYDVTLTFFQKTFDTTTHIFWHCGSGAKFFPRNVSTENQHVSVVKHPTTRNSQTVTRCLRKEIANCAYSQRWYVVCVRARQRHLHCAKNRMMQQSCFAVRSNVILIIRKLSWLFFTTRLSCWQHGVSVKF